MVARQRPVVRCGLGVQRGHFAAMGSTPRLENGAQEDEVAWRKRSVCCFACDRETRRSMISGALSGLPRLARCDRRRSRGVRPCALALATPTCRLNELSMPFSLGRRGLGLSGLVTSRGIAVYTISVARRFEWDAVKAGISYRKHRIRFEDAITAFDDPFARIRFDEEHSHGDICEILLGQSIRGLLIVVFTDRSTDVRRVIGARRATRNERRQYEEGI